jgi:hypothetical protein
MLALPQEELCAVASHTWSLTLRVHIATIDLAQKEQV